MSAATVQQTRTNGSVEPRSPSSRLSARRAARRPRRLSTACGRRLWTLWTPDRVAAWRRGRACGRRPAARRRPPCRLRLHDDRDARRAGLRAGRTRCERSAADAEEIGTRLRAHAARRRRRCRRRSRGSWPPPRAGRALAGELCGWATTVARGGRLLAGAGPALLADRGGSTSGDRRRPRAGAARPAGTRIPARWPTWSAASPGRPTAWPPSAATWPVRHHAAPDWLGADAGAAAAQVGAVATWSRRCSAAVLTAAGRLSAHAEVVTAARRSIAALRASRPTTSPPPGAAVPPRRPRHGGPHGRARGGRAGGGPAAGRGGPQARARGTARDVAPTGAVTGRLLAESSAVVGGRVPRRHDQGVASLAAELPGWGDQELTARGLASRRRSPAVSGPASWRRRHAPAPVCRAGGLRHRAAPGLRSRRHPAALLYRLGDTDLSTGPALARLLARASGPRGRRERPTTRSASC